MLNSILHESKSSKLSLKLELTIQLSILPIEHFEWVENKLSTTVQNGKNGPSISKRNKMLLSFAMLINRPTLSDIIDGSRQISASYGIRMENLLKTSNETTSSDPDRLKGKNIQQRLSNLSKKLFTQ